MSCKGANLSDLIRLRLAKLQCFAHGIDSRMYDYAICRDGEFHVGFKVMSSGNAAVQRVEQPGCHEHLDNCLAHVVVFASLHRLDYFATKV